MVATVCLGPGERPNADRGSLCGMVWCGVCWCVLVCVLVVVVVVVVVEWGGVGYV